MAKELKPKTGEKRTAAEETITALMQTADKETRERRTEHPSIAVEPSVWNEFKLLAKAKNTTPNALLCDLLKDAVQQNQEKINKYKELIGE